MTDPSTIPRNVKNKKKLITGKNGRAGAISHFWRILTNLGYFLSLWVAGKRFLIFFLGNLTRSFR